MGKPARVGLRLWDRLILFTAWVVTCGFVYLLGFYVGKGTQERRLGEEERVVRLPVTSTPPPEGQRPKVPTQPSFYDELLSGRPADVPGSAPPAAQETAASPPAAAPTPPPTAPAVAPRAVAAVAKPPATVPPPTARPPVPPALAAVTAPPAAPPAPAAARSGPPAPPGPWTVEANPTRSLSEAETLAGQLRRRGYDVALTHVVRDGETWYRLRVGRYATSEQASQMMRRLREQEGVTHAFVASEQ